MRCGSRRARVHEWADEYRRPELQDLTAEDAGFMRLLEATRALLRQT